MVTHLITTFGLSIRQACRILNRSWSVDFMHDSLICGRRFRTFNVVNDFNREALWIETDLNLPAQQVVRVPDRIAANRGYPVILRMDNGPEFIPLILAEWAAKHAVKLEFIKPGKPTQNAFISSDLLSLAGKALTFQKKLTW